MQVRGLGMWIGAVLLVGGAGCGSGEDGRTTPSGAPSAPSQGGGEAPTPFDEAAAPGSGVLAAHAEPARPSPDRYLVVLRPGAEVGPSAKKLLATYGGESARLVHVYEHVLHGFAIELSAEAAKTMRGDPLVVSVERDEIAKATHVEHAGGTPSWTPKALWNLDRMDQRSLPLDQLYHYPHSSRSVHAYVIDSGLKSSNVEFSGRASLDMNFVADGVTDEDCAAHGTHVAATLGGQYFGVAKNVRLHGLRVLGCSNSGYLSDIIAALDWVVAHKQLPAIVNMSIVCPKNTSIETAIANTVAAGITVVVAAGNDNQDADNSGIARVPEAITVGASDMTDARASFSNFGPKIDVFAPGVNVMSASPYAWNLGPLWRPSSFDDRGHTQMAGTSMASPLVAGVAALYLSQFPTATPAQVQTAIVSNATPNVLAAGTLGAGSPNRLLYSGFIAHSHTCCGESLAGPTMRLFTEGSRAYYQVGYVFSSAVSDDVEIDRVEYKVNGPTGALVWSTTRRPPNLWFILGINEAGTQEVVFSTEGVYTIVATAFAADAAVVTDTITVTLDSTLPVLNVTSPAAGTWIGPNTWVPVTATATDAAMHHVAAWLDGATYASATQPPWTNNVIANFTIPEGPTQLTVQAQDIAVNTTTQYVLVNIDHTAPTVQLLTPTSGTTVSGPATLTASATDAGSGVAQVSYFANGTLIGSATSAPYSVIWDTSGLTPGSYTLTATAYDRVQMSASTTASVIVAAGPPSLVPAMTSNTGPSGTVTRSGVYSASYESWQAFDGDSQTMWLSNQNASSVYLGYEWGPGIEKVVTTYTLSYNNGSCCDQRGPKNWTLQGWDGAAWITVDTVVNQTGWYATPNRTFAVDAPNRYFKYRLNITADNFNNATYPITLVSIGALKLNGYTAITPKMTTATAPSGTVTRSGAYGSSSEGWLALDATNNTLWLSNQNTSSVWLAYDWGGTTKKVTAYEIIYANGSANEQRGPKSWRLEGLNGTTWTTVDTVTNETGWYANGYRVFTVDTPGFYRAYRLNVTADNYNNPTYPITLVSIATLGLLGP